MKFLHTSDWHLGKKLEGRDRNLEQRAAIEEIAKICDAENIDAVIIAGDIFDTALPSGEAETLFYEGMALLSKRGARKVIVIAGNHDDVGRVTAADKLARIADITLCGGADSVCFERNGEKAVIAMLAYPSESGMAELSNAEGGKEKGETLFGEKVKSWFSVGANAFRKDTINIAVSHLFALEAQGGGEGDERDITLGGANLVAKKYFPQSHYTALGHIHKPMAIDKVRNIWYSGSILSYSFDEKGGKEVIVFDCDKSGVKSLKHIPLTSGKGLKVLTAKSFSEAYSLLEKNTDKYTLLKLNLKEPLADSQNKELRNTFPDLLKIELVLPESADEAERGSLKELSNEEIFRGFYKRENNMDAPKDVTALFLKLMEGDTSI